MAAFRKVATADQIPDGRGIAVEVEGRRVAIFNVEGQYRAIEAACTRHQAPLDKGFLEDGVLFCPWHGVEFDLEKGICAAFPNTPSTATFETKREGNDILLLL